MTGRFAYPIRIIIRNSKWLAVYFLASHIGAIIVLLFVAIPFRAYIFISLLILCNLVYLLYLHYFNTSPFSPVEIYLDHEDNWWITCRNGIAKRVELRGACFVHPKLIILRLGQAMHGFNFILTPDVVDHDLLRRLRVRLKFMRTRNIHHI